MKNDELIKAGEEVVKRRQPKRSEMLKVEPPPEDVSLSLQHSLEISSWGDIDTNNQEQVAKRLDLYYQTCIKNGVRPNVAALALTLGIDRRTLYYWVTGVIPKPEAVMVFIKKAYNIMNSMMEDWMQTGKINPVSGIFLMKNNLSYKDQQEVVVTPNNPLGEINDQKELEKRYLDSIPEAAESNSEEVIDQNPSPKE